MALKYGAMGDAQANLNKNEDALSLLDKAASASDDAYTSYYFTRKAGLLALAMKKNAEAKKYFETIEEKYAGCEGSSGRDAQTARGANDWRPMFGSWRRRLS